VEFWEAVETRLRGKKCLILGIGNSMRGDDAIGPLLAGRLNGRVDAEVIDAEEVPENYIDPIIQAKPEVLVILDAASLDAPPGSVAIIELDNIASAGLSTHRASLNLFLLVLASEIHPDIFILGIQPQSTAFGAPLSQPVQVALGNIEKAFLEILPLK
jgi:hydrogenase 3 maturation protease